MQALNNGIFSVKPVRDIEGNSFAFRINHITGELVRFPSIKKALDSTADKSLYYCELPVKRLDTSHKSLCISDGIKPSAKYKGTTTADIKPHTPIENIGSYMPSFNLHLGFESVVKAARDSVKREIVKSERKPLFAAYVKACNKYQLVVLPDQTQKPFNVCAGSVFHTCAGSIDRYMELVTNTLKRDLTKKESVFIRSQYQPITANDRSKIKDCSLSSLWSKGAAHTKSEIYAAFQSTKTLRFDHKLVFDYNDEVQKIRSMLKKGLLTHAEYKARYSDLKEKKEKVEQVLKTSAGAAIRNMHKNGSTIRVMHNAKGTAGTGSTGSRYTVDGYSVKESEVKPIRQRNVSDERDNASKGELPAFWLERLASPEQKRSEVIGYMEWLAKREPFNG